MAYRSLFLAVVLVFFPGILQQREGMVGGQTETENLTAKQIFKNVENTYTRCKSYRDSGTVKRVLKGGSKIEYEDTFETLFLRPDRFRFEWRHIALLPMKRQIIHATVWRKGDDWRFDEFIPPELRPRIKIPAPVPGTDPLTAAITRMTAYGYPEAHSVTMLLLPKLNGIDPITEISDAKRIEDAKLDKTDCFRLMGEEAENLTTTIWINKKTFLILRIDRTWKTPKVSQEATTTYEPQIDVKITEKMLEFHREEK